MNIELAHKAMQMALDNGCLDVKIVLMKNREQNIAVRNTEIDQMQESVSSSLVMNLFIDGRDGFFYTNRLDEQSVRDFIHHAVDMTRILEPDDSQVLASPERYYRGNGPDLMNFDKSLFAVSPREKLALTMSNNTRLYGFDKRIISLESRYTDRSHEAYYLISNGFEGYEQNTCCTLSTLITVNGAQGQHPMDGWGMSRLFYTQLVDLDIAEIAMERTLRKIGQRPTSSGIYTMILESPVAGSLLHPLLNALSGQAWQQKSSFLLDSLGKQMASPLLTLVDDPLIPGTQGAALFDTDGVATQRRVVFDKGVPQTCFINTSSARKLGMEPTTQCPHHLIFQQGASTLSQLMQQVGHGILVTDLNGGNCDPVTGNFSYGIEGFLFDNGHIVQPLSGMNITGNMLQLWQHLVMAGNDADPWEMDLIPSLVFEQVSFGGV